MATTPASRTQAEEIERLKQAIKRNAIEAARMIGVHEQYTADAKSELNELQRQRDGLVDRIEAEKEHVIRWGTERDAAVSELADMRALAVDLASSYQRYTRRGVALKNEAEHVDLMDRARAAGLLDP